jgi:hypothetical protein
MLTMVVAAEPAHRERLRVIVVVSLNVLRTAHLARLRRE